MSRTAYLKGQFLKAVQNYSSGSTKIEVLVSGLDSAWSELGPVASSSDHCNEQLCSIKAGKFLI
jgi:hypothetical protein